MRTFFAAALFLAAVSVGTGQNITTAELEKYLEKKEVFFLDVREPKEIKELGSVPGYVNIPLADIEKRASEIPRDKLIVTL
ncbi:MAG: rhodanese-like domain-containing protein [Bryobacteraceae bacterium]